MTYRGLTWDHPRGYNALAAAGGELIGDYARFAVTGFSEALAVVPRSLRMIRQLGDAAAGRRPDVCVAIDFPDFNFRLLPRIHALGIPIVYYISPQVWAWRAGRIDVLRRYVTRMAVIGVVLGVVAAWFVGRAARSLLFGVEAGDPLAIVAAAAVVAAVTLGAAYLPARRASRVDPMSVLRYE